MSRKILVVDDDHQQRELYLDLFKSKGFDVISAKDGLEALEFTNREKPGLVFTGIIMPRMDGFTFIENLKKNKETAEIPIIMFSHLGREEDKLRAKKMAVEFMIKGIDGPTDILRKVEELIKA